MNYHDTAARILENGGITEALNGAVPFFGFAYSLDCCEERIPVGRFNEYALASYVQAHLAELSMSGNYLGAWIDDGEVVLDISQVSLKLADAWTLAARHGQESVYDVETGLALTVPAGIPARVAA